MFLQPRTKLLLFWSAKKKPKKPTGGLNFFMASLSKDTILGELTVLLLILIAKTASNSTSFLIVLIDTHPSGSLRAWSNK